MAYVKKEYIQSEAVSKLQDAYNQQLQSKPGDYVSKYQAQMDALLGKIQGRGEFAYDLNQDALYRQYRNQYIRQGQQAMQDAMGQASALTGGYANSYAQTLGQQTYQGYLQGLQDRIPELYTLALEKYQMEGEDLLSRYKLLADQEEADYQQYRDILEDWDHQTQRLYQQYLQEREFDYGSFEDQEDFAYRQYRDTVSDAQWQSAFDYQQEQNLLAYEQWLQEFEYQKAQDQLAYEQWLKEFDENLRRYELEHSGSSGGGSYRGSGSSKDQASQEDTQKAHAFVENMLNSATSSRFDPERVIDATNALTDSQKKEAQSYLQMVLDAGRMK